MQFSDGIIVDGNGNYAGLDVIDAGTNKQILHNLINDKIEGDKIKYLELYTLEELTYLAYKDYEGFANLKLLEANEYLNKRNWDKIKPEIKIEFYDNSYYVYETNIIYWNPLAGKRSLQHEIGHCISKSIFKEDIYNYGYNKIMPNSYSDYIEVRAEAIVSEIYEESHIYESSLVTDSEYTNINIDNYPKNILLHYFFADKYECNQKDYMKNFINYYQINKDYKLNIFENEWNTQKKLLNIGDKYKW